MSIDNLYNYASDDDPFLLETKGSTFGGPDDPEDSGEFAFGGGSILPDGSINPENYAAVPAELYEKGIITPGQKFKVTNPQTGATTIVVARDKGPSARGRGIDLAPHAMDEIGGETDQSLVVDFRPISDVEEAVAQPFTMDGPTIDASPSGVSTAASPMKYFDPAEQGLSELTPVGSGEPPIKVPPKTGELTIVKTNPDGSKVFNNGYTVYPNGIIEMDAGDAIYHYLPGKSAPVVIQKTDKPDAVKTLKDESGAEHPYTMRDGKMVRVPIEGESESLPADVTAADPFVGLNEQQRARAEAIRTYRAPVTSRMLASKDPELTKILNRIYLADPTFNVAEYDVRKDTMRDFSTKGKTGQNITSINTAVNHLGDMEELSSKIGGTPFKSWNQLVQATSQQVGGNPDLRAYHTAATALEGEFAKMLKGGVASVQEIEEWKQHLDPSRPPEDRRAALNEMISLMAGRIDGIKDSYERSMGKPIDKPLVLGKAAQVLKKHGWDVGESPDVATPPSENLPAPKTKEEYDAIPGGANYIGRDGKVHTKKLAPPWRQ